MSPKPGGPLVPGIMPPVEGYACNACKYRVVDLGSIVRHWKLKHGGNPSGQTQSQKALVQCIFPGIGKVYFEVDPHHVEEADMNIRAYLCMEFLPGQGEDLLVTQD